MNHDVDNDNKNTRRRLLVAAVAASFFSSNNEVKKFTFGSRMKRRSNPDYRSIVKKVTNLKVEKPALFTRMFWLSPQAFDKVLGIIQPKLLPKKFDFAADIEISMEIDPATFSLEQLQGYLSAGVNRVSLGVQAFQEPLLQVSGRSHTVKDIYQAVELIQGLGIVNYSLDLISGLPQQTLTDWENSLEKAIELQPAHLSCYDLVLEAVTPFGKQYQPGKKPLPDDETTAKMYVLAGEKLALAGYQHYEISNYAKPGYQCRHNRVYWENRPYYGFGMGAASYLHQQRFTRPSYL